MLGNEMIPADLVCLVNAVKPQVEAMVSEGGEHPTEFEIVTAAAPITTQRGATTSLWK